MTNPVRLRMPSQEHSRKKSSSEKCWASVPSESVHMRTSFTRLFARSDGASAFEDCGVDLVPDFSVPPVDPLHTASFLAGDGTTFWIGTPTVWNGGAVHPAPRRMIFVTVRGEYEVNTTDGSVKRFPPGSVLIVEDSIGLGPRHTEEGATQPATIPRSNGLLSSRARPY